MNEPNQPPRRYRWPWLVAAAVALGAVLAVLWVSAAVRTVERERDVNGPLPGGSAPAH
jgi:hypothetical protein